MGHKVGWVTLFAGIAGGADIVLIPEIPYDLGVICKAISRRAKSGKRFTILAVAEGAISTEDAKLSKKEYAKKVADRKSPSIAYELADDISKKTGYEVRVTVPGHIQRGGSPVPYDRVLSTRLGAKAADLIINKKFGYMVALKRMEIVPVPLKDVAGKLKTVDPNSDIIHEWPSFLETERTIGLLQQSDNETDQRAFAASRHREQVGGASCFSYY